jgi:hypothetical protein
MWAVEFPSPSKAPAMKSSPLGLSSCQTELLDQQDCLHFVLNPYPKPLLRLKIKKMGSRFIVDAWIGENGLVICEIPHGRPFIASDILRVKTKGARAKDSFRHAWLDTRSAIIAANVESHSITCTSLSPALLSWGMWRLAWTWTGAWFILLRDVELDSALYLAVLLSGRTIRHKCTRMQPHHFFITSG